MRTVSVGGNVVSYTLKRYARSRHLRVIVRSGGHVVVTAPQRARVRDVEEFVRRHAAWIAQTAAATGRHGGRDEYLRLREAAREIAHERLGHYRGLYGTQYGAVRVRDQRTCWGSCSKKKNLNFNYRIAILPERLRDYVVFHEFCHLEELNHSARFWALVSREFPDYSVLRARLRREHRLMQA
jgi:hypothetical protein